MPGDGEVTLSFKREGNDKIYTVTFSFSVHSRKELEIDDINGDGLPDIIAGNSEGANIVYYQTIRSD